jgi:RNA polymerase sigma-70 factor (ECF subfamily)
MDDANWVKKAQKGDSTAFEQLVLAHQNQIYRLCFRMLGNAEDAADMTQETFLKAWRNLDRFQGDAAFSTWLYRLASNCCLDFLRSQKRRPTVSMTTEDDDGEEQTIEVADDSATPEEELLLKEERSEIARAMASLDEEQRQILSLRVVNDLSYTEIAEILDIKEGTVKSRLARARENLRKKLLQIRNKTDGSSSKRQIGGQHEL